MAHHFQPKQKDKTQWEHELEYPDVDHEKAHGIGRKRNVSTVLLTSKLPPLYRRLSHDNMRNQAFLIDVEKTRRELLLQEDTNNDCQITVQDQGPKIFTLGTAGSEGYRTVQVRGTYALSNLLQELSLASEFGRTFITVDLERLNENPLQRLNRLIKYHFWDELTRRMDANGIEKICQDPKNQAVDKKNRVYVPFGDLLGQEYYKDIAMKRPHLNLEMIVLPENITPEYVKSINAKPGILALALRTKETNIGLQIKGTPFVVPGGRFNEMYGWDSYFEALGLLTDGRVELARGMVENFWYEIEHYGKILNANRSYYLTRSQPPFLTDMMIQTYSSLQLKPDFDQARLKKWITTGIKAAVKELFGVWLCPPRLDRTTGLSKYHPEGIGIPPETERKSILTTATHFDHIIKPYASRLGLDIATFAEKYQKNEIVEPALDDYFLHDRAVRESGHDTTYRFEKRCAHLATVDLNSLLFKYEVDLAEMLSTHCNGYIWVYVKNGTNNINYDNFLEWFRLIESDKLIKNFTEWNTSWAKGVMIFEQYASKSEIIKGKYVDYKVCSDIGNIFAVKLSIEIFREIALRTREAINKYLWCEESNLYYDYDCSVLMRSAYQSATAFWPLWAKIPDPQRAKKLVKKCIKLFALPGGIVSGTLESRGHICLDRPERQWDFPFGWAPHQILAWQGLQNYGYTNEQKELVYRWLYSITKSFVEYNGVVPEKFNVDVITHQVNVEYGNVGTDFKFVAKEGFGWMNASYQVIISNLDWPDVT
ncbi:alpha,alpha-trehalase nth1 [Boothiomyces macroporosus]|uniref:Trehalase n=1 Tax=Boothiomyces macroporosus TaxID=261099 RepID=A0AAD5UF48_9FUNG|nr:alpha,alpha-trehalase nth1 [Boothiomyces macroporosus]